MPTPRSSRRDINESIDYEQWEYIDNEGLCVYCGMPEECSDHFVPLSKIEDMRGRYNCSSGKFILSSCKECNSIAGTKVFPTVKEKREYIQERITARHPYRSRWTQKEVDRKFIGRLHQIMTHWVGIIEQTKRRLLWQEINNPEYVRIAEILFCPIAIGSYFAPTNAEQPTSMKRENDFGREGKLRKKKISSNQQPDKEAYNAMLEGFGIETKELNL
jgi:hypothetical protein